MSRASARLDRREVGALRVEHALPVEDGEVGDPGLEQDPGHGDAGGTGAGDHDPGAVAGPPGQPQRVRQRRERDDRRAVLVVVEDRDVEQALEAALDLEAARRRDVLEVDAAEARRQPDHRLDDLLDVGGVEADRDRVDAAELLEEHRLALHDRHRGGGSDVAEAEDGGAVGDDGDGVGDPGVVAGQRRVGGDRLAHPRHPGRVGEGEVVLADQRHRGPDLHLAADVQVEHRVAGVRVRE